MKKQEKAFLATAALSLCLSTALWAQDAAPPAAAGGRGPRVPPPVAWAAKPTTPTGWIAPMKPVWRLAEILAAHKGQADWTEAIVRDSYLQADYI